jgi:hypothetical protein
MVERKTLREDPDKTGSLTKHTKTTKQSRKNPKIELCGLRVLREKSAS